MICTTSVAVSRQPYLENERNREEEHRREQHQEKRVVALPDTIIQDSAVMVES